MQPPELKFEGALSRDGSSLKRARYGEDERPVVVKTLEVHKLESWKAVELFEREARVLRNLDHPRIPRYLAAGRLGDDGPDEKATAFYLVQDYIEGRDLQGLLDIAAARGVGLFDEADAKRFLQEMVEILAYLHSLNPPVIHRNIKPSNIIARHDEGFSLVDFGSVQAVLPQTMTGSTFVGTTGYMAPEQMMGRAVPASDIFSLGATTIHLLSGVHPGNLPVRRMTLDFSRVVDVSEGFERILRKMVAPTLEERYESPAQILAELGRVSNALEKTSDDANLPFALIHATPAYSQIKARKEQGRLEITFHEEPNFFLLLTLTLVFMAIFTLFMFLPGPLKVFLFVGFIILAHFTVPIVTAKLMLIVDRDEVRLEKRSGKRARRLLRLPTRHLHFEVLEGERVLHSRRPSTLMLRTPQEHYTLPFELTYEEAQWVRALAKDQLEEDRSRKR